jgi:hypothetical protein
MERKEILEKKLEVLDELESLKKKEEAHEKASSEKSDKYDLRSLTDPRELGGLRKLTLPGPFGFRGKPK